MPRHALELLLAHVGKYLNGYGERNAREIPPGWSEWHGSVDPSSYRYYDYTLNENGTLVKYGLDYATLSHANPRLIYAGLKGFLPGPYDHRTALDEVVQMMGGLAYMTGRPGDPLRAGSSVNDIMGGMFGAIAILGALIQRGISGRGM